MRGKKISSFAFKVNPVECTQKKSKKKTNQSSSDIVWFHFKVDESKIFKKKKKERKKENDATPIFERANSVSLHPPSNMVSLKVDSIDASQNRNEITKTSSQSILRGFAQSRRAESKNSVKKNEQTRVLSSCTGFNSTNSCN